MLMRKIKEWKVGEDMVSNFTAPPELIDRLEQIIADAVEPTIGDDTVIIQVTVGVAYSKIVKRDQKAS